ncbi:PQQ-binding-like beta-propeller repeat protein [Nocardiopsis alba]|uniref:outer membrane protein assembly factor BamB family protein n=1 Tax=Nocardiopsis alba TaxID=53437 RepID=UPI00366B7F09
MALAVAAALALITGIGVFTLLPRDHEHFTSDGEPEVGDVPREVDHIAWEWDTPEEHSIVTVMPGLAGPVVVMERGVIGLDGATGEELWGYLSDLGGSDVSASVTPDGRSAVIAEVREDENRVSLLDSGTGEIQERYEYPLDSEPPSLLNLSDHDWVEARNGGIVARDLHSGDIAWEYLPERGCEIQALRGSNTFGDTADYSVATSGEHYVLAELCEEHREESEPDAPRPPGDLVVLDAWTGEISWTVEDGLLLEEETRSEIDVPYSALIKIARDESALLAETTSGSTLFDLATGEVLHDDLRSLQRDEGPGRIVDFDDENVVVSERRPGDAGLPEFTNTRTGDGEVLRRTSTEDPLSGDPFEYHRIRPAGSASYSLPLDGGLVTPGCVDECEERNIDETVLFLPWEGKTPPRGIESEKVEAIVQSGRGVFVESPGSVVLYRPGSEGHLIGLA